MTVKAYANTSHTGAIHEIAVSAGRTFYYIKSDNLGWRENLTFPAGTTSIKFLIDSTFPGEVWSDAEIQRGDFISYATHDSRVSGFEVPATGGTGETGGGGGEFAPINSPVFTVTPRRRPQTLSTTTLALLRRTSSKQQSRPSRRLPLLGIFTTRTSSGSRRRRSTRSVATSSRRDWSAVPSPPLPAHSSPAPRRGETQQTPRPASGGGGTGAPDGYLNVKAFGPVGTSDDTATIRAAVAAAKATFNGWSSKGLYFGPGVNYTVKQPIDFRGISNIQCESWLVWAGGDTGASMRFGVTSKTGSGRYIFHGIYDFIGYAARRYSTVQFSGLQGGHVEIGACNGYVEVYAEPGDYYSVFNSRFFLGRTWRLELHSQGGNAGPVGAGTGWINTNQFYGGALCQLRIGGVWYDCLTTQQGANTLVTTAEPHTVHHGLPGRTVQRHGRSGPPRSGHCAQCNAVHHSGLLYRLRLEVHGPRRLPAQRQLIQQHEHRRPSGDGLHPGSVQSHHWLPDGGKRRACLRARSLPEHCRGVQHHAWAHAFGWRGRRHDAPRLLERQQLLRLGETAQALGSVT